jgi:8-amino-7-oxononanoate synthase
MGTLSKTLAASGGYVAGSSALIECIRYSAPGFVYSVGLTPPDTAAALTALRIMRREPERVRHLRQLSAQFVAYARRHGLNTGTSGGSAVVPVIFGDSTLTMRVAHALFEVGINVHPIIYPSVEEKSARLRFFVTSLHTSKQLYDALDALVAALANFSTLAGRSI